VSDGFWTDARVRVALGLPEMDGRQVVEKMRAERANLKVLDMHVYAEMAASGDFLQKGMEIISKPFSMEKLANKIREVIESVRAPV
jgi:DNA-binding response OmpR family regulator